jgi:ATP-dependent protease ClpP protease subunit
MRPWYLLAAVATCFNVCDALMPPLSRAQLIKTGASVVAGVTTALSHPLACASADGDDYSDSPEVERSHNRIFFYTGVSGASCAALRRAIADATLEAQVYQLTLSQPQPVPIELHIQSPGGSLMHAFGIIDYIQRNSVLVV